MLQKLYARCSQTKDKVAIIQNKIISNVNVCLSICRSLVILCRVYLLIFVLIWVTDLDEHLLFSKPVTVLYIVLFLLSYCCTVD